MRCFFSPRALDAESDTPLGAALLVTLSAGCRNATSVTLPSMDVETISPLTDIENAAAPNGAQQKTKGHIVFVRDGNVHIMNANGSGVTQLTTHVWRPVAGVVTERSAGRVRESSKWGQRHLRRERRWKRARLHSPRTAASTPPQRGRLAGAQIAFAQ